MKLFTTWETDYNNKLGYRIPVRDSGNIWNQFTKLDAKQSTIFTDRVQISARVDLTECMVSGTREPAEPGAALVRVTGTHLVCSVGH